MPLSRDEARRILAAGACAPSYHNIQPWRARVVDDRIDVFLDRERSGHLLDRSRLASLLAIGAFVDNAQTAAAALGLDTSVELRSHTSCDEPVASLLVEQRRPPPPGADERVEALRRRCTNRRAPDDRAISAEVIARLSEAGSEIPGHRVVWRSEPMPKLELGQLLSEGAALALFNPAIHTEFFRHNRWTADEAVQTMDGIDVATLEVDDNGANWLRRMADPDVFLAEVDRDQVVEGPLPSLVTSSHLGVLVGRGLEPRDGLDAGRALVRLWNQATTEGLMLQPMGVILLFGLETPEVLRSTLSAEELEDAQGYLALLDELVERKAEETPMFAFRLFFADPPSARSLRRSVDDFTEWGTADHRDPS